jgi:regulatory protein
MKDGGVKDPQKVADRMRALCSRREYCRKDVMKKVMTALDGDVAKAEEVVAKLVEERYVDDLRYATAFARDKASIAGWGEAKIRYMLSSKGIDRELIAQALEEVDDKRAETRLEKLMENKVRSLKDDPQRRLKLLRFGLGRGYSYDQVTEMIDKLL